MSPFLWERGSLGEVGGRHMVSSIQLSFTAEHAQKLGSVVSQGSNPLRVNAFPAVPRLL